MAALNVVWRHCELILNVVWRQLSHTASHSKHQKPKRLTDCLQTGGAYKVVLTRWCLQSAYKVLTKWCLQSAYKEVLTNRWCLQGGAYKVVITRWCLQSAYKQTAYKVVLTRWRLQCAYKVVLTNRLLTNGLQTAYKQTAYKQLTDCLQTQTD